MPETHHHSVETREGAGKSFSFKIFLSSCVVGWCE